MVYEKMAIVTEPRKVFWSIVQSVPIFVMNSQYPLIARFTNFTYFLSSRPFEYSRVG